MLQCVVVCRRVSKTTTHGDTVQHAKYIYIYIYIYCVVECFSVLQCVCVYIVLKSVAVCCSVL